MFQHLKNIETAFHHVQLFTLVLIVACGATCCYTIFTCYRFSEQMMGKVYVIANGKALEAVATSKKENLPVEAKDHIATFHRYFFNLPPDEKAIEANMQRALYLADQSAKVAYDNLQESGYYTQFVSANMSQDLVVDSVLVLTSEYPYRFRFYGKQHIQRPTATILRSLVTEGMLRDLGIRTENNSHGFLIERWSIIENKDLEIRKR